MASRSNRAALASLNHPHIAALYADARSDVFSFGSVLYELLTGRQPFQGDTVAAVLVREPDLGALPPNLNPRLPELLKRCLEKNPKRRWQAVGDLRAAARVPL